MARPKLLPDNFTLCLVGTVIFASLLPVHGQAAVGFDWVTNVAVGLLFFLHGAKLSREAIVAGATQWRLHRSRTAQHVQRLFPLLGLALKPLLSPLVTPALYAGVLFLCTLPSTVQSSIAFTSIAKGNVPAAVCSASASSLLGIFITPALVSVLVTNQAAGGSSPWHTVGNIVLQLLVPFVAGQLLRPLIGKWIERHRSVLQVRRPGFDSAGGVRRVQRVRVPRACGTRFRSPPSAACCSSAWCCSRSRWASPFS